MIVSILKAIHPESPASCVWVLAIHVGRREANLIVKVRQA
jgi:hypothetical protein